MRARHALIGLSGAAAVTLITGALMVAPTASAQQTPSNVAANCAASTKPHVMHCMSLRRTDIVGQFSLAPNATPSGLGPADLKSAYKLPSGGSGATVAIVDANDDPKAEADLGVYRSQFGLPACTTANGCFRKVNQNGQASPLPAPDAGWAGEIALDLDMVSATCPSCQILLVEANSANDADLYAAVDRAVAMGAKYVSNSWGGPESSRQTTDDAHFNRPGIAITVSSGDNGTGAEYPSSSRYVTSVGGTSLRTASNSRGWTESAWSGAGSGCSAYDAKPSWQSVTTTCSRRAAADVSAVADPATGVAVYTSYQASGWNVYGGTSASAPIVASVYALAGTPGANDYPASYPYSHGGDLFDVASGNNGSCGAPICNAGAGWDGPTGLGTPNGVAAFAAGGGTPPPPPPPGGGGCTAAQLLGNPGFESGTAAPWSANSGVVDSSSSEPAHSGSWKAWLDGYGSAHTDTLSQSVSIPAGCTSATMSFWLKIDTAETTTGTAYDKLVVAADGTTLATYSNLDRSGYVQKTLDLKPYIGKTVRIAFTGTEDSSLQTSFVIDDTAVNVG